MTMAGDGVNDDNSSDGPTTDNHNDETEGIKGIGQKVSEMPKQKASQIEQWQHSGE